MWLEVTYGCVCPRRMYSYTQCVLYLLIEFYFLFCFGAKIGAQFTTLISIKNLKSWYEDLGKYFKYLVEEFCCSLRQQ